MQIGYDAKRAFTNTSGLGNYSRFIITGMQQHFPANQYNLYTPTSAKAFANFNESIPRIKVTRPQGIYKLLPNLWRIRGLTSQLKKDGIQLYHGLSNELPSGINQSIKTVVTIHDLIFIRYPELYKPIDRFIYRHKFTTACRRANKIVAISEQTKADIRTYLKIPAGNIEVVYQDCNPIFHQKHEAAYLNQIKQKYRLPEGFILCVGTLEPRKNQLTLLKACHQAGIAHSAPLVFIGRRTAYYQELQKYIASQRLERKVLFLPYIPTEELPAIYQLASLFVYPSLFEGFGIPIVEALNSGVPVITSIGSCFSEAGGPETRYIDPANQEELASQLQAVLSDSALRQKMVSAGQTYALKFRPEQTITQLHHIYKKLVND